MLISRAVVVSVGAKIVFVLVMVEAACQISTARYQVWCRPKNPKKARNIHNCRSKNRFYAAEFRFRCPTELRETRNRDIVTPCVINDKRYMLRSPNMDARLQSRDLVNGLTFQSRRSIDKRGYLFRGCLRVSSCHIVSSSQALRFCQCRSRKGGRNVLE